MSCIWFQVIKRETRQLRSGPLSSYSSSFFLLPQGLAAPSPRHTTARRSSQPTRLWSSHPPNAANASAACLASTCHATTMAPPCSETLPLVPCSLAPPPQLLTPLDTYVDTRCSSVQHEEKRDKPHPLILEEDEHPQVQVYSTNIPYSGWIMSSLSHNQILAKKKNRPILSPIIPWTKHMLTVAIYSTVNFSIFNFKCFMDSHRFFFTHVCNKLNQNCGLKVKWGRVQYFGPYGWKKDAVFEKRKYALLFVGSFQGDFLDTTLAIASEWGWPIQFKAGMSTIGD